MQIVAKLKAVQWTGRKQRAHDLYGVYEGDVLITSFGVRRGSSKDAGHDHIPKDLLISPKDARDLAQCPMSRDEYIKKLKQKGKI